MEKEYNTLIVITPKDCERLLKLYPRLVTNLECGKVCFIGADGVGDIVKNDDGIGGRVNFINEDTILKFDAVHKCMEAKMKPLLNGADLPRGITGWYYQQFVKMQYALKTNDEYYMVWDGDTIPCKKIEMFQENSGKPYLDMKHEEHGEYFETMGTLLPGMRKMVGRSFISEHMLFKTDIMKELISAIENNSSLFGTTFWEKVIDAIPLEKIQSSSFSEFETYGTYVALRRPDAYMLREWHSFRLGGAFFKVDTISDRDCDWLARDFHAISFEKGDFVREDNAGLFDNPYYQEKLTPKQMLQAAQQEFEEGYKEVWEDDEELRDGANNRSGEY